MKIKRFFLFLLILCLLTALPSCSRAAYTPTGEFYLKTSPAIGDAGVEDVISLEADRKEYRGDGDISVTMTVGLGHLPGELGYGEDAGDTFYVRYQISEAPWNADITPVWEKKVEYTDSWYDAKYDSTEQKNRSFLIFPSYGEFYPLYKETVEIVFPAELEKGYLQVSVYAVVPGHEHHQSITGMNFYFERVDGVLTLDPHAT